MALRHLFRLIRYSNRPLLTTLGAVTQFTARWLPRARYNKVSTSNVYWNIIVLLYMIKNLFKTGQASPYNIYRKGR